MDHFDTFLNNVLSQRQRSVTGELSDEENAYLTRLSSNSQDIQREYASILATIIVNNDKDSFFKLIDVLIPQACECPLYQLDLLEPLFIVFSPKMSELMKRSHLFCSCRKYVDGYVNHWKTDHNDVFDTEMFFYTYIHDRFNHLITIDTPKYDLKELTSKRKPSKPSKPHSEEEKLKQMYTIIYFYDVLTQ
jgi:hypothetical protein